MRLNKLKMSSERREEEKITKIKKINYM